MEQETDKWSILSCPRNQPVCRTQIQADVRSTSIVGFRFGNTHKTQASLTSLLGPVSSSVPCCVREVGKQVRMALYVYGGPPLADEVTPEKRFSPMNRTVPSLSRLIQQDAQRSTEIGTLFKVRPASSNRPRLASVSQ